MSKGVAHARAACAEMARGVYGLLKGQQSPVYTDQYSSVYTGSLVWLSRLPQTL
jgi:hypothetical protein